jgi:hypothetical protein
MSSRQHLNKKFKADDRMTCRCISNNCINKYGGFDTIAKSTYRKHQKDEHALFKELGNE